MRRLASNSEVVAFVDIPVETSRFRQFPGTVPVSHAFTGYFTCQEHEKLFFDVENCQPDFGNERHLDLLAYKGLIKALWDKKILGGAWSAVAAEDSKSDMPDFQVRLFAEMERGINVLKQAVEIKLGLIDNGPSSRSLASTLQHHIVRVPSRVQSVAMSS